MLTFDCKDTNSNRRTLKSACKRLNFNYFKDRLVHFNGTVVIEIYFRYYRVYNMLVDKNLEYLLAPSLLT